MNARAARAAMKSLPRSVRVSARAMRAYGGQAVMAMARVALTIPGAAIFLVGLGFNLLGDGLRDVLDPKAR